ncbi:MAG: hypothetical protein R2864_02095 [Syntrophotaleaceae bacterium]
MAVDFELAQGAVQGARDRRQRRSGCIRASRWPVDSRGRCRAFEQQQNDRLNETGDIAEATALRAASPAVATGSARHGIPSESNILVLI